METEKILDEKFQKLKDDLSMLEKVAVAFSGGVDSTFLLKTAQEVLGENAIAVTACSEFVPPREIKESQAFCEKEGIRQILCQVEALAIEGISENPKDRCYICKKALMGKLKQKAEAAGMFVLAEGSNMDDLGDYRPGLKAVEELGIRSPLKEAGLTKSDIRKLSARMGLPTWDKPSFACLASRFVYGETITKEKLSIWITDFLRCGCASMGTPPGSNCRLKTLRVFLKTESEEKCQKNLRRLGLLMYRWTLKGIGPEA